MRSLEDYIAFKDWQHVRNLAHIEVSFTNAIYLDQACVLELMQETDSTTKLRLNGRFSSHLVKWLS